jgi:hypothetical protein
MVVDPATLSLIAYTVGDAVTRDRLRRQGDTKQLSQHLHVPRVRAFFVSEGIAGTEL